MISSLNNNTHYNNIFYYMLSLFIQILRKNKSQKKIFWASVNKSWSGFLPLGAILLVYVSIFKMGGFIKKNGIIVFFVFTTVFELFFSFVFLLFVLVAIVIQLLYSVCSEWCFHWWVCCCYLIFYYYFIIIDIIIILLLLLFLSTWKLLERKYRIWFFGCYLYW